MTYHQSSPDQQPVAYEALRQLSNEDHTLDVDKGDRITPEELEMLSFDEQGCFRPVYEDEEKEVFDAEEFRDKNFPGIGDI